MKTRVFFALLILFYAFIAGCSLPAKAIEKSLCSFTREEKINKSMFGKKKTILVKDFRGNEVYEEDMAGLKEEVEKYISGHPDLSEPGKTNLRELRVTEGIPKEEVKLLLGAPDKITRISSVKKEASEAWIYKLKKMNVFSVFIIPVLLVHQAYYLYFQDNLLVNMEKHYLKQTVEQNAGPGLFDDPKKETSK